MKVVILGTDSSHTEAYGALMAEGGNLSQEITELCLWGENSQETAEKAKALRCGACHTLDEALGKADLALVLGRFGESHFAPAKAALARGLATFVDKPFVHSFKEARELMTLAEQNQARLCSWSSARFDPVISSGVGLKLISGPRNCLSLGPDPRFKSVFFYGIHSVEMALQLRGSTPERVKASSSKDAIQAHFLYSRLPDLTVEIRNNHDEEDFYGVDSRNQRRNISFGIEIYEYSLRKILDFALGKDLAVPLTQSLFAVGLLEQLEAKGFFQEQFLELHGEP